MVAGVDTAAPGGGTALTSLFRGELGDRLTEVGELFAAGDFAGALAGYEALIAEAYKLVAAGWAQQAASCKAVGRVGSSTVEWRLPTRFTEAMEFVRDHEGAQAHLAAINAMEFGKDPAAVTAERNQKREKIGRIRAELARRQAERSTSQAQTVYQDELSRIRS